jgi:hypothetical protein
VCQEYGRCCIEQQSSLLQAAECLSPLFGSGFAKVAHTLIESMSVFSTHSHSLGYLVVRYGFDPIRKKRLLK